uniref:DUF6398 domain-containing protein n=1 Tax=Capnocytophaga canimorsus TaxID=28188 RepID=A0A1X7BZD9_9FLAO|nr:conserved hypothetical protein [Capnocytophaga canimorsus]
MSKDKEHIKEREAQILTLIEEFCNQKLDDDYLKLSKKLVKKLGRKRVVPFKTGQVEIWAAAVIHALGTINFLFDKSFKPYASFDDINNFFGTKKSTITAKSKLIRDLLNLTHFNSDFSTQYIDIQNPFNDMVMVNGMALPIWILPEQSQNAVRKAREKGLDISFSFTDTD